MRRILVGLVLVIAIAASDALGQNQYLLPQGPRHQTAIDDDGTTARE